jgi:hypothetical protein
MLIINLVQTQYNGISPTEIAQSGCKGSNKSIKYHAIIYLIFIFPVTLDAEKKKAYF